jgi:hypothetical protein
VEVDPDVDIAAANIQRLFRGSAARKKAMREREEELVYIGMKPPKQNRYVYFRLCMLHSSYTCCIQTQYDESAYIYYSTLT